ncbi:hypothetical protein IAR55_004707 [Kwoniella newhampshirensis]|uniref:Uncharacterized protein n=1 Tax=Kwoniella newhampshirensis TaxID=1651941 RepID=A0AAW0YWK3_9TREE
MLVTSKTVSLVIFAALCFFTMSASATPTLLRRRTAPTPTPAPYLKHVTRAQLVDQATKKKSRRARRPATSVRSGNLQTYTGAIEGVSAPPVYTWGYNHYRSSGVEYGSLIGALDASCYEQMEQCQDAARRRGIMGLLVVLECDTVQYIGCLNWASRISS